MYVTSVLAPTQYLTNFYIFFYIALVLTVNFIKSVIKFTVHSYNVILAALNFCGSKDKVEVHIIRKQHIKAIITGEIIKHKINLSQVKNYIEKKSGKSLSSIDEAYIERKYIKCCSKLWLTEMRDMLKGIAGRKSKDTILEVFSSLDKIESLNHVPNPFKLLGYYKLLIEHYKLLSKKDENTLIGRFKEECLEQTVTYSEAAGRELQFLETFVDFVSASENLQSVTAELRLKDFCGGKLPFGEFLKRIIYLDGSAYGESLAVLQEAAKCLQQEKDLFLIGKFKEVIGAYIKPVEIQVREIDNRLVIEVKGKNVVISEILRRLENEISRNSNIEEVRFVGADIVRVDANLENGIWHGKNIVILAKIIKVCDEVVWNVSGNDKNHPDSDNAGTGEDGHGKQGADGDAGESGGNVLILAEKIKNPENFTIVSNGGKGGKGQDGGNGGKGEDGKGIRKAEFDKKFPLVCDCTNLTVTGARMIQTLENIEDDSLRVETVWCEGINNATIQKIIKNTSFALTGGEYSFFIETVTSRGKITFSFQRNALFTRRQAFFLYEGSKGQPGGHGGKCGLGGEGGYPGEITVRNSGSGQEFGITKIAKRGEEGEKGKGGLYGQHGKNGLDMGYLDYQFWRETEFRKNGKYKVEYYYNNSSDRVWCPYKQKYAGIIPAKIEHKKQNKYEERENIRRNDDRQHNAQAVRKKNNVQGRILAGYSHLLRSVEKSTLQDLRSDLENTKNRALQAVAKNQEQEKQTVELGIKRHVSSVHQGKHKRCNVTIPSATYTGTTDVDGLTDRLKGEPRLLDSWLQLRGVELNRSELDELFSYFETVKESFFETQNSQNDTKNRELQSIEKLLIDKYRLATLQEIAKQLPPYQEGTGNRELTPESAARYLVEAKENDNNISHPVLGTLNQYFFERNEEQHNKISRFCEEELQNSNENREILKRSLKIFVLEVGESQEVHPCITKHYNEHKELLEKQKSSLNIFFEAFKSELSRPRHTNVFDLWIGSTKDKSLGSKLEEKIQKDAFLKALYDRFNNQLKLDYDWNKCCKDQDILKEYNIYIKGKGPLSQCYRELLAYVFGINIRLYVEDQYNRLSIQDNHNPSSKQAVHLLCRDNEFIQLHVDENYLKLEEERKKKDDLYARIFAEIEPFEQKQKFDDYLQKKFFLSDNNLLEDKKSNQSFNDVHSTSKEEDIGKIIEYFPEEEKQQLKERLEKITSPHIGQQGVSRYILKRFSSEGKHVSYQELCCLINSILTSSIEDRKEQNTFCWMVAAYPQRNWIDELILLQLENYFKKPLAEIPKWREYLSKIENKDILLLLNVKLDQCKPGNSISTQRIEDILYLLSNIPNETVSLEGLELSEWSYALKEKYWTCKLSKLVDWQNSDLPTASYYLLSIENIFGTDLLENFLEALAEKKQEISADMLTDILSNFHNEKWNLSEGELKTLKSCDISKWAQKMQQKFTADNGERDVTQLVGLIKGNANTSKGISDKLTKIEKSIMSICKTKYVIAGKSVGGFTEDDIKKWVKKIKGGNINKGKQDIESEMLAVIDRAIELKRGFKLRDTQRLTVLTLLTNDSNTLAQVSTGEGKSLIVVAASIVKALCGEKVDIVTSSSVLAKRDAECNRDIYSWFDINVSHNCSEDIEKRKEAYSGNQIVYGDLSNFQRDYLLDKFYGKNILGDHNFKNVIVDEVDSMLLDKGNNMLYLSHDLAGLDKLESVYVYIWQWINRPATNREELSYAFNTKAIREAVLSDLYLVKKEDIGKLGSELSEQQKNIIWECLTKAEILDDQGKLLRGSVDDSILSEVLPSEFIRYKGRLGYLIKECVEREKCIHVPNHLRPFVELHLESWINSAKTAFFMKAGQDYVVDVDRTGTSPDRNPNITILDRDTGTDQANSQWDEALHQFLQLKHGCKLSLQSLKAVFVSNVSFFKLYNKLYGLTGTLGSQRERDLLLEIYGVDFVTIPTAKSKQFREDKPILCTSKKEWINHIRNEVEKLTEQEKRSVLIICETVNDVETLHKDFWGKDAKHVHTYTRDYEEFDIAQGTKALEQGQVIIATNLAGRGTDIKIADELRKGNGLHVCLTYLPNNIRIEQQAFGRAARSGDKGSGQLIIMDTKGKEYSNSKILDLKKERDAEELHRISDIKAHYETQIAAEENCFTAFKKQYEQLQKNLDDKQVPTEVKDILLQSCMDKWAFWLDENGKYIRNLIDEQRKRSFYDLLNKFISQFKNLDTGYKEKWLTWLIEHDSKRWLAWVDRHPAHMIKLGKYLSQNKEHDKAVELFDAVIKQEPYFSEAAHYYKAFALAKGIDWKQKPLRVKDKDVLKRVKKELRESARLLEERSKFSMINAAIIGKIKKRNTESIIQIDAYEEQQTSLISLYNMFSRSIDDILGHFVTAQSFVNYNIKEELAEILYEDLLREGVLKQPRVKKNISEEELKVINSGYEISAKTLKEFLSGYGGKEIDEKKFQKELKDAIPLPSQEAFWKSLIKQEILNEEVKYVVVDSKKLREFDPSLPDALDEKVKKKELEKKSLESGEGEVFCNVEGIAKRKDNDNFVFRKDDFKAADEVMYQTLKRKGVLSFNGKARIDQSKIQSATFPDYDSITAEDFTKVNIATSEGEYILTELVQQEVLERDDKNPKSIAYRLKVKFEKIGQVQLPSCPVYENAVQGLLSACFTYRIALQKIAKYLEEKNYPVHLQLVTKPYKILVSKLLEQKIIRLATVTTKGEDLETKLKSIYSQTMDKDGFKLVLSQSKRIPYRYIAELFDHLVEKGWITQYNPKQSFQEKGIRAIGKENFVNASKSFVQDLYYVNGADKGRKPLKSSYEDIENTVKEILDSRLELAKEDTIKNITRTLERSRIALKMLEFPDSKLKPLTEFCGQGKSANIEEVHLFFLNGLDQLLQLEERKWTQKMILNTSIVVAMGIAQIAIGTAIELYSVGVMTHVGAAFVNEGVSDIFFAASALRSGYYRWNDYKQHKLQSLVVTAATAGIGAYLSKGAKVSTFGNKLAGPSIEVGRKKVAEICGSQLIQIAGRKVVVKEFVKRMALKAIEGVAFGLANAGVDTLVENYLQALCKDIASSILSDIEREVERHNISESLEKAYRKLGEKEAKIMIDNLTKSVFSRPSYENEFLYIAIKIANCVRGGIAEALKKRNATSNKLEWTICTISKVVVWSESAAQIDKITRVTGNLLNNIDQEIKDKINKPEKDSERGSTSKKQEAEEGYKNFKEDVIGQWKLQLRRTAGKVIEQNIVSPILKWGANYLVSKCGKKIKEWYQSYKESELYGQHEGMKLQYQEELRNAGEQGSSDTSQTECHITTKYQESLLNLMKKTRDPEFLAAIVRENVPMDMTCVSACLPVVHRILEERGIVIPGLTIVVTAEGGIRQEFSSVPEGRESIIIKLVLKSNHFQLSGSGTSENNINGELQNNCLYEALAGVIHELRDVTPETFRAEVASCIEQDREIRYHIIQGWHQLPLSLGAFGGATSRARSKLVHDPESSSYDEEQFSNNEEFLCREHSISDHILDRFTRLFRLGGIIQRISEQTRIPRKRVVKGGASQYQDRHGKVETPAAHVVRAGKIHVKIKKLHKLNFNELKNFLGHTQNVARYANEWHGIGGDIDKIQSGSLKKLASIDFRRSLTAEDASTIKSVKKEFIAALHKRINEGALGNKWVLEELINVRTALTDFKLEAAFEKGKDGYSGKNMKDYQ